jgi:hypothetical protein
MPGLALELQLCDANNLPLGFYSSGVFSQVVLPTQPGRYVITAALQPLFLASGDYSFDIATTSLATVTDHEVPKAVPFHVIASNPGTMAYDFRQGLGKGAIALHLAEPLRIEAKPAGLG